MKKLFLFLGLLALVLSICGCSATPYQPGDGSWAGGYKDFRIAPGIYRISFEGNAYVSGEKAYHYTLYRAAEVTKENDCEWFEIIEKSETARTEYAGCLLGNVEKPRNAIVIKVFKDNPPENAYFAEDLLKSLDEK